MKKITHILIEYDDGSINRKEEFYSDHSTIPIETLFRFLVQEGFYDDIKVTKTYSTANEVLNRMKGGD